jgi:hypothetical protein
LQKLRLAYFKDLDEGEAPLEFVFQSQMPIERREKKERCAAKLAIEKPAKEISAHYT